MYSIYSCFLKGGEDSIVVVVFPPDFRAQGLKGKKKLVKKRARSPLKMADKTFKSLYI